MGVSLDRLLRDAYVPLESFLSRGGRLRALLVDPDARDAVAIADRRAYQEHGVDRRREHIEGSIATLDELQRKTQGDVHIRTTNDPLTFGAIMVDPTQATAVSRIVVSHYSYKKRHATEPNPVFNVRPSDGVWFEDFREEIENLWQDAR